jgi:hypothetical protein
MNTTRRRAIPAVCAAIAVAVVLLAGCPNPVTQLTVSQMLDKAAPTVTIFSPVSNTAYTQTVTVQGTALDSGQLRSLTYTVTGTLGVLATGEVPLASIGAGGSFSFQFGTIDFSGPVAVAVAARDWNDNVGTAVLTLTSPGSSVSSFTAVPGNRRVQMDWEEVPGALDYTIYYTTNGTLPTETYGNQVVVAAPVHTRTLTGLKNGAKHVFLLKARTADRNFWSGYEEQVPLSQFTLAPVVAGGYREIFLSWSTIEATNGFYVYRATDPAGPYLSYTGMVTGSSFTDTSVADNTWYYYEVQPAVTDGIRSAYNGAQTVQIPPTQADRIASMYSPAPAQKVKVVGSYAYVAAQSAGLLVVDVSDPGAPFLVGSVATTAATDVDVSGGYAYVADGAGGLRVIDISVPQSPQVVGTYGWTNAMATSVSVAGGPGGGSPYLYAFVLDSYSSTTTAVRVVNLAIPGSPALVTTLSWGAAYQLTDVEAIYGLAANPTWTYVYMPARKAQAPDLNSGALFEYYIAPPPDASLHVGRPAYVYPNQGTPTNHFRPMRAVATSSYVYAFAEMAAHLESAPLRLLIINRSAFTLSGETATMNIMYGGAKDVAVSGTRAFVADAIGVQSISVAVPTAPTLGTYWDTPGTSQGVATNGTTAFVTSGAFGFQSINLMQASPTIVGSLPQGTGTPGFRGLAVRGRYLYAAAGQAGTARLQIVDIQNPLAPANVAGGSVALAGPNAVALSGDYAFIANGSAGLSVVNVSIPASPQFITSTAFSGTAYSVVVRGSYAYVAGHDSLQVFNIEDPQAPFVIGFFPSTAVVWDLAVSGDLVYYVDGAYFDTNSIRVVSFADMFNPVLLGENATYSGAATLSGISVYGDYAFITDSSAGSNLGVYAVKVNPPNVTPLPSYGPCLTGPGSTAATSEGVFAFGPYAFVAVSTSGAGVAVIDVSTPTALSNSKLITNVTWAYSSAQRIVAGGKYIYVTDDNFNAANVALKVIRLF